VNASALKSKRRDNQALRRQESGANKKNRIYLTDSGNNQSASGSFSIFASDTLEPIESSQWLKLTNSAKFTEGVIPSVTFSEVETRYIQVHFEISNAGLIGNFGVTGPITTSRAEFTLDKGATTQHLR
jgi:hypothetical protein